jgi:hypothetical protein
MRFRKIPGWVWIVAVLAAAVALGSSPFWLLAISCSTTPGGC